MSDLREVIEDFELLAEIATDLSMQFDGINTENRRKKISTYFLAKLVHNCISLLKISPESKYSTDDFLDFTSIASLSRNIIEATNLCWYYCLEDVDGAEAEFRLLLYDYHDICTLLAISDNLGFSVENNSQLKFDKETLKNILVDTEQFKQLEMPKQKQIKKGHKAALFNHAELIERRKINISEFRGMYKLLSNHVHSMPGSINGVVYSRLHSQEMDLVFCGLTLAYVASFVAEMIRAIGEQWQIQFAKIESQELVEEYARNLFEIT